MTGKRFTKVSSDGYWKIKDSQADYKEVWDLTNPQLIEDRLNQLNDENEQLKERNNNQYHQLQHLWKLIEAKDWETLSDMVTQMKKDNERLQQEWKCYE